MKYKGLNTYDEILDYFTSHTGPIWGTVVMKRPTNTVSGLWEFNFSAWGDTHTLKSEGYRPVLFEEIECFYVLISFDSGEDDAVVDAVRGLEKQLKTLKRAVGIQ